MEHFEHGGNVNSDILYDFSANINPLGLPESVKKTLAENISKFSDYPDPGCTRLIEKISEIEKIFSKKIVCGNGAADLIYRLVYAVRPKRALILAPTFSEYEKALAEVGCEIKYHFLRENENFRVTERLFSDLKNIDIFFLCNPNNPTGNIIEPLLLKEISLRCQQKNILLVADECFMDFVADRKKYALQIRRGIVLIKAFTKIYAMAGLRLGYMLFGDEELAEKVRRTGQCWSVSVPAQLVGEAALSEKEYAAKTVELIEAERNYLYNSLCGLGIKAYPSRTNFILFFSKLPLDKLLKKEKIAIRNCKNFIGLNENYFRIAVKKHDANAALINALKKILKERGENI